MDPLSLLLPSVSTVACLLVYASSISAAGAARRKHEVAPPSMEGPPEFLRCVRAQQNTLESLVMVLPLIWLSAILLPHLHLGPGAAFVGGLAWAFYRRSYIQGYAREAKDRVPGFRGSLMALKFLLVVTAIGCLYQLAIIVGRSTLMGGAQ